jgi:hypothetical protein
LLYQNEKNWFILLAILLGIGGFFFYRNTTATNKLISDLIPDNTLLLLEAYQPNEASIKSKLQELPFTDSLFPIATELEHYGLKGERLDALLPIAYYILLIFHKPKNVLLGHTLFLLFLKMSLYSTN